MLSRACSIVGIEFAVLVGVLSLPAVKFRLVFWNLSNFCGVFAESLQESVRSFAVFRSVCVVSPELTVKI